MNQATNDGNLQEIGNNQAEHPPCYLEVVVGGMMGPRKETQAEPGEYPEFQSLNWKYKDCRLLHIFLLATRRHCGVTDSWKL